MNTPSKEQSTFSDILLRNCHDFESHTAYTFLADGEKEEINITYKELLFEAQRIAGYLQSNVSPGARALLFFHPGLDFIITFYACLLAKVIAVPSYPPRNNRLISRIDAIIKNADAEVILTNLPSSIFKKYGASFNHYSHIINVQEVDASYQNKWKHVNYSKDDIAFLQYTSGSTGNPKGVIISHENIIANQKLIQKGFRQTQDSIIVGWLPFYHDMGLVGNILHPMYLGAKSILMKPQHFLQKPERWLTAISNYSATTSGGPNFAYDLCVNKIPNHIIDSLNLGTWEVAFTGAETVRVETIRRFNEKFKNCGFTSTSFQPCYGMAESTLLISVEKGSLGAKSKTFERKKLSLEYLQSDIESLGEIELVSCGSPDKGNLIIVGKNLKELEDGQVGEICIKGNSVTKGYWNAKDLNSNIFFLSRDKNSLFFKTGDLGLINEGALYITGRAKDIIIINGQNYYPDDIEAVIRNACKKINVCAAFSIENRDKEHLVVIAEMRTSKESEYAIAVKNINKMLFTELQLSVLFIGFIRQGTILKTSSGKVQRGACKEAYLNESFNFLNKENEQTVDSTDYKDEELKLTEKKIIDVFQEIFERKIDADEDFFNLGIDSIKAAQIAVLLSETFDKELSIDLIFEYSTISLLAVNIHRQDITNNISYSLDINSSKIYSEATSMQNSIWFHQRLNPNSNSYNIPLCINIGKNLDIDAVSMALGHVVKKYEILRTVFVYEGNKLKQHVSDDSISKVKSISYTLPSEKKTSLSDFYKQELKLDSYPLWRAAVLENEDHSYSFLFVIHHIISDGYSLALIKKEILELYPQYLLTNDIAITQPKFQYRNYAESIKERDDAKHEEYWREQLKGTLNRLKLPKKLNVDNDKTSRSQQIVIPQYVYEQLVRVSKSTNSSIYMVLLSAFVILLNKLTNQDDIIVGAPIADRDHFGMKDMLGVFVNIVMLRVSVDEYDSFTNVLSKVKKTVLDAHKHKAYPFDKVVDMFSAGQDSSGFAISSIFFNGLNFTDELENDYEAFPSNLGLDINFDINYYAIILSSEIRIRVDYKTALFDYDIIEAMLSKYLQIISEVVCDLNLSISHIKTHTKLPPVPCIDDADWYKPNNSICNIISKQFAKYENNIAVSASHVQLTYKQLGNITDRWCNYILACNSDKSPICFLVAHNQNMPVSVISILKTGRCYVPLDPEFPIVRLKMIVNEVAPTVLLTDNDNIDLALQLYEEEGTLVINIDDTTLINGYKHTRKQIAVEGSSPAYVLYTSGSSGAPKGVLQTHENLLHFISNYTSAINITDKDRLTGFSSCSYDSFNNDLYGALLNGATYYPMSIKEKIDPGALAKWLDTNNITIWHSVPTVFSLYAKKWSQNEMKIMSLRIVKMTGELVTNSHFSLFKQIVQPTASFVVSLGSTESTLHCINIYEFSQEEHCLVLPVGYPTNRTKVHIMDDYSKCLDVLEIGEIVIESDFVSPLYINHKELTDATFVVKDKKNYYKTGDIGRKLPNGKIEWLNRKDTVVKKNGVRIDTGEIEYYLTQISNVKEAAIVNKFSDDFTESELICYISSIGELSIDNVVSYLEKKIPQTFLPSVYINVDDIPKTPSGKIDRQVVLTWNIKAAISSEELEQALTSTEKVVVDIWQSVLDVPINNSTSTNFFQIGGNSIKAMQTVNALNDVFEIDLPLKMLFENPTISELSKYIDVIGWHDTSTLPDEEIDEFVI